MNYTTILILAAVIEVIILICFFILCSNVNDMKKIIVPNNNFRPLFLLYYSIGEKEKAKELLLKAISLDDVFMDAFYLDSSNRTVSQQDILKKYDVFLKMVDITLDLSVLDKYVKNQFK